VKLHAVNPERPCAESFDGPVVGVDESNLDAGYLSYVRLDGVAVILAGYENPSRFPVDHRLIRTAMSEFHFVRIRSQGQRGQLVPQADSQHRYLSNEPADPVDHAFDVTRIAGTVGQDEEIEIAPRYLFRREIMPENSQVDAETSEAPQYPFLHSQVHDGRLRPLALAQPVASRHPCHEVPARVRRRTPRYRDEILVPSPGGTYHCVHGPFRADLARDGSGINTFQTRELLFLEKAPKTPPPRRRREGFRELPHHQGLGGASITLAVGGIDAVVAYLRIRHGDYLPSVGGIGQHLLVTGHRGVENHLPAYGKAVRRSEEAVEAGSVREDQLAFGFGPIAHGSLPAAGADRASGR